jgi:hypothetical protein
VDDSEAVRMERVNRFLNEHSKGWSKERWIRIKEDLHDCVWVEGALLAHQDSDRIYFAPEPTQFGLIYEIRKSDIREALATGQRKSKLGTTTRLFGCTFTKMRYWCVWNGALHRRYRW